MKRSGNASSLSSKKIIRFTEAIQSPLLNTDDRGWIVEVSRELKNTSHGKDPLN